MGNAEWQLHQTAEPWNREKGLDISGPLHPKVGEEGEDRTSQGLAQLVPRIQRTAPASGAVLIWAPHHAPDVARHAFP